MRKIESVTVTKLFGFEGNDYTVEFIKDSPITFMYALNGAGKTTLLKLIYAALNQKIFILDSINFKQLKIVFSTGEELEIRKLCDCKFDDMEMFDLSKDNKGYFFPIVYFLKKTKDGNILEGKYYLSQQENGTRQFAMKDIYLNRYITDISEGLKEIKEFLNGLVNSNILFANKDYSRNLQNKTLAEIINRENPYGIDFMPYPSSDVVSFKINTAERLIEKRKRELAVAKRDLDLLIGGTIAVATMPIMGPVLWPVLLKKVRTKKRKNSNIGDIDHVISTEQLLHNYHGEEKYIDFPLPDKINPINLRLKEICSPVNKKINLFEEIINTFNGLTDKNIIINRETGEIRFYTVFDEQKTFSADLLSSGEKNLLLLYFHLIFEVNDSLTEEQTYIELIDEPEVSMHPDWLTSFIGSLKHINDVLGRKDNYQYIIATHSPVITYEHSHLMVEMVRD